MNRQYPTTEYEDDNVRVVAINAEWSMLVTKDPTNLSPKVTFIKEPEPEEHLSLTIMKQLTGDDTFYARPLHSQHPAA